MLKFISDSILDVLFPRRCFGCGLENMALCEACIGEFPPAPAESGDVTAYAPFSYRHPPLKKALWALKFEGNTEVARICARLLYDRIIPLIEEYASYRGVKMPLLVPVPISRRRRWARGYNQTECIARELARLDGGSSFELFTGALIKTKDVPPQTTLREKTARMKNIEGCFATKHPDSINGRDVIVLDDIYTTGATFGEAKRVLKRARARTVICVAVAH
mgnify:CR=1 FL=1